MQYCLMCGAANNSFSRKCKKCNHNFDKPKVIHHDPKYPRDIPTKSEFQASTDPEEFDEQFSGTSLDEIEPFSQEEISRFRVAGANQAFNLKDIMKKNADKDTGKKAKKKPKRKK